MGFYDAKVLFCSKSGDENCEKALEYLKQNCSNLTICMGDWGDVIPPEMYSWAGDYILSFMSKWIIPESVLKKAQRGAINFHPGPPSHPGAACANYALYDGDSEFGVTCHHMTPKVDSGKIIMTRKFPIHASDNVSSLLERTHGETLKLFFDIITIIREGNNLPESTETWDRTNFHTRNDLNENLRKISADVSEEEFKRIVRATLFNEWKPYLMIHGVKFVMEEDNEQGLGTRD